MMKEYCQILINTLNEFDYNYSKTESISLDNVEYDRNHLPDPNEDFVNYHVETDDNRMVITVYNSVESAKQEYDEALETMGEFGAGIRVGPVTIQAGEITEFKKFITSLNNKYKCD